MSPRVEELLIRWEELRQSGKPVSVDALCRDCPDLRNELQAHIAALEKMDQVLDLSDNVPPAEKSQRRPTCYDDLRPGWEPITGYRLEKPLGKGGFGEVWRAIGHGGFAVALKFVPLTSQLGATEIRSLDVIKTLHHPNLLAIFGAWQVHGFLVVAMELADKTLLDRLNEATASGSPGISHDELIGYMEAAAKGIDYLNQSDDDLGDSSKEAIQHRDIKPQNIFLMGGGVKIGDFGLLRILKNTVTDHTGSLTVSYAAPEFFMGHTSRSSDQYSFAVTYCHLRGGRLPFVGNPGQVMQGHVEGTPDLTMLPESERPIATRALAKQPGERWPTCTAFVDALKNAQTRARTPKKKSNLVPLILLAVVLPIAISLVGLSCLGIFWAGSWWSNVPPGKDKAVDVDKKAPPDKDKLVDVGKKPTPQEEKLAQARVFLENGRKFYEAKDYSSALASFSEALKFDRSFAWAYADRGLTFYRLKKHDECIQDCTEAIRIAPSNDKDLMGRCYERRAHAYLAKGKSFADQAIAEYTESFKYMPTSGHNYFQRAAAYRLKGDKKKSDADLKKAKELGYTW
jgi:serine/threonine protein kinase